MFLRRLPLDGTANTRELGGYPISKKEYTKYQRFLRSDALGECTADDITYLKDYGLRTVIDLRNKNEIISIHNPFAACQGINYFHIPLIEDMDLIDSNNIQNMIFIQLYNCILENKQSMKAVFSTMAAYPEGVLLFHCTAGKDRTGLITCILLMLAGVSKPDIVADYQITFTLNYRLMEIFLKKYPQTPIHAFKSEPEYMWETYDFIIERYGNAYEYLLNIGLTPEEITILKEKMI